MTNAQKTIRLFISSPGDVAEERDKARAVIARLASRYGDQVILKPVLWEDFALTADQPFQPGIDDILSKEHGIDIAVFILWSRLGSPVGGPTQKADGSPYRSGTERELDLMLQARARSQAEAETTGGLVRPAILVYTRNDADAFEEVLKGKNTAELQTLIEQRSLVEQFIREEFHDDQGHNLRAYHTYRKAPDFSGRLRVHLIEWLDDLLGGGGISWEQAPYVGLQAFDFEQEKIFIGRERQVCELAESLRAQAEQGCAFVLVAGASGSGKSSLVRAGLMPALCFHEVDESVAQWRRAILRPGEHDGNLLLALVRRLAADGEALPELRTAATQGLEQLAADLGVSPEITVRNVLGRAFADAAQAAQGPVRLLLLIDQLEELFTDSSLTPSERETFLQVLETLARSGQVWVVATLRSDFYAQMQHSPTLMRMREGRGLYDLLPVDESSLRRIIVVPASLAGQRFEGRTEEEKTPLEDRIYADALQHAELLPHLQYLLRELYEARTPDHLLTHAAYTALGGVGGVLGHRAQTVFAALDTATQAAFDPFLRALVTIQTEEPQNAVRRRAPLALVQDTPEKKQLTAALIEARLLTTDKSPAGEPMVSLAHETLLSSWEALSRWIADNRSFLKIRSRVENAARLWQENEQKPDFLLPEGLQLAEAQGIVAEFPQEIGEEPKAFVSASSEMLATRRQLEVKRLRRRSTIYASLAIVTMVAGLVAGWQWLESDRNEKLAINETRKAKMTLSQSDFFQGIDNIARNDTAAGMAYLAHAIRNHPEHRHLSAAARIGNLLLQRVYILTLFEPLEHGESVISAVFSPDGAKIVTASVNHTARVWDAATGKPLTEPLQHGDWVTSAVFSPDGTKVVTASKDNTARVWDAATGEPLTEPLQHGYGVRSAVFSPDSTKVITASEDKSARVWDAANGRPLTEPLQHGKWVLSAVFSPDGAKVVTASEDKSARVRDAATGKHLTEPLQHGAPVYLAVFSPDSTKVVTASEDHTARVWDATTGRPLTEPLQHGHRVRSAVFSPDGAKVVTASDDHTARVWDAATGRPLTEPLQHGKSVYSAVFSPDGAKVVTASEDKTARVWDTATGRPLTEPLQHGSRVFSAVFSPDGAKVVTASDDHTARVWHVAIGKPLVGPLQYGDRVVFSPDGSKVVTTSKDKSVRVWDVATGKPLTEPLQHGDFVNSVVFSPDGAKIVTASDDHTARVWDAATGKPLTESLQHGKWVLSAVFSPDCAKIVTVSVDHTARVWDVATGKTLTEPLQHGDFVNSVVFSPDGAKIVTASYDKTARVWDTATGRPLTEPLQHGGWVYSAIFSSDSAKVVTASYDKTARVWDAATGKPLTEPLQHGDRVYSAIFSPDGAKTVTASEDQTARVWDAETGELLTEPLQHGASVFSAAFSPDGAKIVTASEDHTARVWDAATGKPLTEPLQHGDWVYSAVFSPDGAKIVTASKDKTARVWPIAPLSTIPLPDWLAPLAEAVAGYRVNDQGILEPVPTSQILQFRERFQKSKDKDPYSQIARWFFANPSTRPASPYQMD